MYSLDNGKVQMNNTFVNISRYVARFRCEAFSS